MTYLITGQFTDGSKTDTGESVARSSASIFTASLIATIRSGQTADETYDVTPTDADFDLADAMTARAFESDECECVKAITGGGWVRVRFES